jgi:DNA mismatch repair ATPase MutS
MEFKSIMYNDSDNLEKLDSNNSIIDDFSLRNIFKGIIGNIKNDELEDFLYRPLNNLDNILYRQEIFKDLANPQIYTTMSQFVARSSQMRYNIEILNNMESLQQERWLLDSVSLYCMSLIDLLNNMSKFSLKSRGFLEFYRYLDNYIKSNEFESLRKETEDLETSISSIKYLINIKGVKITVRKDKDSDNYASIVQKTFSRFLDEDEIIHGHDSSPGVGHVEAAIVELVAKFYPEIFSKLEEFYKKRLTFMDGIISKFMHEIVFYLKYLDYIRPMEESGLNFCIPEIKDNPDKVYCMEFFDLTLAGKLQERHEIPVTNSIIVNRDSSMVIVTGPNNGGKTTFARSFGQLHYLALLGLPVPGKSASILYVDKIFSHFERTENPENNMGRLEEELERLHNILENATERSLIIINEMLSSTTHKDGIEIGRNIIHLMQEKKIFCMYVTFIHELAELPGVTSYVSQIDSKNPEIRTYKILPRKPDGMAYAKALANKYGLTYEILKERIL